MKRETLIVTDPLRAAALAERTRIRSILTAPEARGREAAARHLALNTDLTSAAAIAALKTASAAAHAQGGAASWDDIAATLNSTGGR